MLELQRNIIFGQYVSTGSVVHRLDPRLKLLATAFLVAASFVINDLIGFLLLFPLLALMHILSRVPFGYVVRGSRFFIIFLAVFLAFDILFYPAAGSSALWKWRLVSVSGPGIVLAALIAAKVLLLYDVTTMLMLTTPLVDLTDGMEALLSPLQRLRLPVNELVLVGVIAFKFVPIFTAEAERLSRAQTARGVPFDQGGPIVRARRMGRLLVPIFISAFRRADALTMAMDARCYRGGHGRTKLRRLQAGPRDWLAVLVVGLWVLAAWYAPGRLIG
jgi:energy-coupling factor transport system permease protein